MGIFVRTGGADCSAERVKNMEYIYEILRKSEQIPNAYKEWREYRKEVTAYLLSKLKRQSHIAVLGAGESNDLELKRIVEAGHQVTLLDANDAAMQRGIQKQFGEAMLQSGCQDYIRVKHCNVWPVTVEDYHHLEEMLFCCTDMTALIGFMKTLMQRIEESPLDLGDGYDWIVVLGLHSQVNIMFVSLLQYYMNTFGLRYSETEVNSYLTMVSHMNQNMTGYLQIPLMKAAKHQLFGYEYASFDSGDERIYEVQNQFRQGRADLVKKMGISRVEGAVQWEQLLSREYAKNRLEIKDWDYFIWPFCKEKRYLMVLYECCNKEYYK